MQHTCLDRFIDTNGLIVLSYCRNFLCKYNAFMLLDGIYYLMEFV